MSAIELLKPFLQEKWTFEHEMKIQEDMIPAMIDGKESDGVVTNVKTPKVSVIGSGVTAPTDESGLYVVKWDAPTTGQMKVLVGDKLYTTVAASTKQVSIPKSDIKYDLFNMPQVQLLHVDDNGQESAITRPDGASGNNGGGLGSIPGASAELAEILSPLKLLGSGVGLLGVVGAFVLLGLAFRVVPHLVKTIRSSFLNSKTR